MTRRERIRAALNKPHTPPVKAVLLGAVVSAVANAIVEYRKDNRILALELRIAALERTEAERSGILRSIRHWPNPFLPKPAINPEEQP